MQWRRRRRVVRITAAARNHGGDAAPAFYGERATRRPPPHSKVDFRDFIPLMAVTPSVFPPFRPAILENHHCRRETRNSSSESALACDFALPFAKI